VDHQDVLITWAEKVREDQSMSNLLAVAAVMRKMGETRLELSQDDINQVVKTIEPNVSFDAERNVWLFTLRPRT
jgi:hypothetical protein